ncbi:hypothetical protein E2320_010105 [Naja naja]|nr:hypothetical protein E2320_010105 [Naja naja]
MQELLGDGIVFGLVAFFMLFGEEAFCYSLCHYFEGHTSKKKEPFFKAYLVGVSPSMAQQGNFLPSTHTLLPNCCLPSCFATELSCICFSQHVQPC